MTTPNTLEFAQILQEELDQQAMEVSTSGWMEPNAEQVKYNGGNEIKIGVLDMDGLGDYDRVNGFGAGAVDLKFETRTMEMDRGRSFTLDSMDVDETNFLASATKVMGEFQRTKVIPEIDSYRYSKLFQYANESNRITDDYTPTESSIIKQITSDVFQIKEEVGEDVELIASISTAAYQVLINNDKIKKTLDTGTFERNEIKFSFKMLDGVFLSVVPSKRMLTEYIFRTGQLNTPQSPGGFTPSPTARQLNWIISARNVPIAVSKQDKVRIFDPNTNQQADAYKIDYRRYHDLWVLPQQMNKLWANRRPA